MAYIGQPFTGPSTGAVQHESGNGSTTVYTLDFAVGSSESVATYLDGVRQVPGSGKDYTAAGVTLTFSTAVPSGVSILIQYLALPIALPEPGNDTVTGAKIVDNAVDSEHYTDGSIDLAHMSSQSVDEDNLHISNSGSNGQFLSKQSGNAGGLTWAAAAGITLGTAAATTSGATIDFTGIPSGTKRILVNVDKISTSGSSHPMLQIGDSGGFETSAYAGCIAWTQGSNVVVSSNFTTGFGVFANWGSSTIGSGTNVLSLLDPATNTWVSSSSHGRNGNVGNWHGGGGKSLSGVLTQVRFTMVNGADTFDAGKINISYE